MEYYYNNFPKLWWKYGFKDGYNLEKKSPWFAEEYIGIDKGIELLMLENYLNGTVWRYFMKNKYVRAGLDILKIKRIAKYKNDSGIIGATMLEYIQWNIYVRVLKSWIDKLEKIAYYITIILNRRAKKWIEKKS